MNDHVVELLALYALGGLEPEEGERVEAHLIECAACRGEAEALLGLSGLVAQSVPAAEPPASVRDSVLNRIGSPRSPRPAADIPPPRPRRPALSEQRRGARPSPARPAWQWALAGAGALVLLGLLGWNLSLNVQLASLQQQIAVQEQTVSSLSTQTAGQTHEIQDLREQLESQEQTVRLIASPGARTIDLAGQAPVPQAGGRAYVPESRTDVVLVVWNLPPLGPNQIYQAWVITDAGPQPSNLFSVNESGWGMTSLALLPDQLVFAGFGVSREPAGGGQTPTEIVLVGGL